MRDKIKEILLQSKELIPVVVIEDENNAAPLSQAITNAGGQFIEITLRTQAALSAIKKIKQKNKDIIVGAGTVLTISDAQKAIDAGADFLVSPGLDEEVVIYALKQGKLMIPGTITPTEIQQGVRLGLNILKFFPAQDAGGASMIKALGTVYPDIKFMPTGGINEHNIKDYIALSNVGCIGGSWVCTKDDIKQGNFGVITQKLKAVNTLF